jgi:hypothetical protein
VSDTANTATPSANTGTDPNSTRTDTINVDAPLGLTYNPALSSSPTTSFVKAVVGRHYGVSSDTCAGAGACKPIVYEAKTGLGTYVFTPGSFPAGFNHVESPNVRNQDVTSSFSAAPITGGSAAYTPSVTVDDTANISTPDAANSATAPGAVSGTLTVAGEMTLTTPGGLFAKAVIGRHYGMAADACVPGPNCAPLTYTVPAATPGLGGSYAFTPNNFPSGFGCTTAANSANCSDNARVGGPAGTLNNLNVTVTDTANASTPQGSVTSTNSTMMITSPLTSSLTQAGTPAATLLPAVTNRSYGVINAGAGLPTYTAINGLGGYTFPAAPTGLGAGSGFTCSSTNPYTCSAGTVALAAGSYTISLGGVNISR